MAATTAQPTGSLPSGLGICTAAPDVFYLPELVSGSVVWILVASTYVDPPNPLGRVTFVSVFCFVGTFLWTEVIRTSPAGLLLSRTLPGSLLLPHAGVDLAYITFQKNPADLKIYHIDIAAVVFAYVATLFYFIHTILSSIRWKNF
ncbi:myelin and lymphocyte protein-like [Anarrhichthys ocellatus]|uniref:myelin and lymphocyte protein-like n=1 Tax=Anarrhichthys ocellatus TaxID=433405 RepID=UPI0012EE2EA0|nr:myelin and lymphocyte protein-like [Anarrhichthys ocellatus]